jgi:small subunit ribosomal protein S20
MFPRPDPEDSLAQHKSAAKRARQSLKRRERNRSIASRVKTRVKQFRTAADSGDAEATRSALRAAEGELRRAASKGVIPRSRVNRQVARLARRAHQVAP